tara:strand:+ start:5726 stop:6100 length:375 start_codon:yes stop_codon:yes gene_type:complete
MTQKRATDFGNVHPLWAAINSLAVKVIPPLMVACVIAVTGGAWATYNSVNKLIDKTSQHDADFTAVRTEIALLKADLKNLESSSVKRQELLEILKRVEQQLEIALLRSGVKIPPKMLSGSGSHE